MLGRLTDELKFINTYDRDSTEINTVSIDSKIISEFAKSRRTCEKKIKDLNIESLENSFSVIKNLFYLICTTLNDYHLIVEHIGKENIKNFFKTWKRYDLKSANTYGKELHNIIVQLCDTGMENDLKNEVLQLYKEDGKTIVISKNRFDVSKQTDQIQTIYSPQVFLTERYQEDYDNLLFIGSTRLFPLAIRTIFFGRKNTYIGYSVYPNNFECTEIADFAPNKISRTFKSTVINTSNSNSEKDLMDVNEDNLYMISFEENDLIAIESKRRRIFEIDETSIDCEAYEINFFSGHYGFYPLRSKFNVFSGDYNLQETGISSLKEGLVVVFRETNQKEILKEKAATNLGKVNYYQYWNEINFFRRELKKKIDLLGIKGTRDELNKLGIRIASDLTIKNWLSETIRPGKFISIMENYLGIDHEKAKKVDVAASTIKSAHVKAGKELTSELHIFLKELPLETKKLITKKLKEQKYLSLESIDYGTIYFEIVKDVDTEKSRVPVQMVSEIFER